MNISNETIKKLMNCFWGSFINHNLEFIAHRESNIYFNLETCQNELELKCKVLEYFSRSAHKSEPYGTAKKNNTLHKFMANGINEFLGTNFTEQDFETIYIPLGNGVNRELCIKFVESGYDLSLLA